MRTFQLNKTVVSLTGDAAKFLADYSTNTSDASLNAFIDLKGCIVATFHQIQTKENSFFLIVETPFIKRLEEHLAKYLPLYEVELQVIQDKYVYFVCGAESSGFEYEYQIPFADGIVLITSTKTNESTMSEEDFQLYRVQNNWPLQGIDYDQTMLLNLNQMDFISLEKGCYLGQEIIARVHYKGTPPKKLIVKYESQCSEEEKKSLTSRSLDPSKDQYMGFVMELTKA